MARSFAAVSVFCLLVTLGCARNPVSGRPEVVLVSAAKEREIGAEEAAKVEALMGLANHADLQGYVREIGQRLATHSPRQDVDYSFYIVDSPEPNAFALPGGYIYLSRGILALVNSEDELAAVIGHEIGHVAARHHVQRATLATPFAVVLGLPAAIVGTLSRTLGDVVAAPGKIAGGLILARHSRQQERDADRFGMELAARAGWAPEALASFLHTLEREEALTREGPRRTDFFDSHPAMPERVATVRKRAQGVEQIPARPIVADRKALLDRLEGLLVGTNPASGIFAENDFLHPELDFALTFPATWPTQNQPHYVVAVAPEEQERVAALLTLVGEGDDPVDGARRDELEEELLEKLTRTDIHGLPAARVVTEKRGSGFDLTWIAHRGRLYRIVGVAPSASFARYEGAFAEIARSFRSLTAKDRARILEQRLRVHAARSGESVAGFVERTRGAWSSEQVAIANGLANDAALAGGQLLKTAITQPHAPERR